MDKEEIIKLIREEIKNYMKTAAFTDRKLTDTPTDALSVVNRKFVTMNGTTAQRPLGSILGQRFFDTTINKPIYWKGTGWVDSQGSDL
jgi:hypothetical protein